MLTMLESCEENGNAMAEYRVSSSEMMVMFHGLQIDKNTQDDTQDNTQDNNLNLQNVEFSEKEKKILCICKKPRSRQEIAELLGYKNIKSIKMEMEELLETGWLNMTIPDKPKSKNQKYIVAENSDEQ